MEFTTREQDVIRCLFEGLSIKQIAPLLGLAPNTVKGRVRRIADKLGIDRGPFIPRVRIVYLLSMDPYWIEQFKQTRFFRDVPGLAERWR